jgi:putative glycerol-1-phosphate prenyltransferase
MNVYEKIFENFEKGKKMLAILIDPDKYADDKLAERLPEINAAQPDFILVGGSLTFEPTEKVVETIKQHSPIPTILFPGNVNQFYGKADALFLLSLISGRNAEYLIGQHITAAPAIYRSGIEVIPVGYMLIEGGVKTSVEYVSNTNPIPAEKVEIAVATAIAGEMLGQKLIYLEGGSGTRNHVSAAMIKAVKQHISVPLIVGGGIRTIEAATEVLSAGADMIVVGNILEQQPALLKEFTQAAKQISIY